MGDERRYYQDPAGDDGLPREEFPPGLTLAASRRDLLRAAGFIFAGAALSGCGRQPTESAVPYLEATEGQVPGRPRWYATVCAGCEAACGVLAKVRDGRPIKLEGNPDHPLSRGGLCPVGQASLLGLYDSRRLRGPRLDGHETTWQHVDTAIAQRLAAAEQAGKPLRVLSTSIVSPTLRAQIAALLAQHPGSRWITYDALSLSAVREAHALTHGAQLVPGYRFDRAQIIVSFGCDFLGTWLSPVEFTAQWRAGRALDGAWPTMSEHLQLEARLSLTGAKADRRYALSPPQQVAVLGHLARILAGWADVRLDTSSLADCPIPAAQVEALAGKLWRARGRSLVVCGHNDTAVQVLVNFVNELLGGYGTTLDLEHRSYQAQGSDSELAALLEELEAGAVGALLLLGGNPVTELPGGPKLATALRQVPLVVSVAAELDETSSLAHAVCPDHHPLESWGDAEPANGLVSLRQPTVAPLYGTRSVLESLERWAGGARDAELILRDHWAAGIAPRQPVASDFEPFWNATLRRGVTDVVPRPLALRPFDFGVVRIPTVEQAGMHLELHASHAMRDGRHAGNGWLHELPDPLTKVTWDNVACLAREDAERLGVAEGDVVRVSVAGAAIELPAYILPGHAPGCVSVALGYGRQASARFADVGPQWLAAQPTVGDDGRVGQNAAALLAWRDGAMQYLRASATLEPTGASRPLAVTQAHHFVDVPAALAPESGPRRPMIQDTTLPAYQRDRHAGHVASHAATGEDLWPEDHRYEGHHWAMVIDLNRCTGCGGCVVACNIENNIPLVGRDEVRRRREMHWLRIDRYFAENDDGTVDVAQQPMLCHHCDNAPCEVVCPVLATVHSEEGLCQQVYNRCVGTRYCANNCPYKVRRFNWFDYPHADEVENLLLNPDVTVRSRGVMEKCSFCAQRIEYARVEARRLGRPMADGDVQPACVQSCPAQAIVFGDRNDPESAVRRQIASPRNYQLLSEYNLKPSVGYLRVVRNRPESGGEPHHG